VIKTVCNYGHWILPKYEGAFIFHKNYERILESELFFNALGCEPIHKKWGIKSALSLEKASVLQVTTGKTKRSVI
jgi:hypothetical protein